MDREEVLFRFKLAKECMEKGLDMPFNNKQFYEMVGVAITALEN